MSIPQVGACSRATARARTRWWTTASACLRRWTTGLCSSPEFEQRIGQSIFVSATPGRWELDRSAGLVVEQVIRPTGLLDPPVEIRPVKGQMDDLLGECKARAARGERVLVTTLTKRMAEDLTEYFNDMGVSSRYLHSDIDTLERIAIIKALRAPENSTCSSASTCCARASTFPEVSLVAILDADKEGFLRFHGRAHSDLRPRRAQRRRPRHSLRRQGDAVHAGRHQRDGAPPRQADRLQRRARHCSRAPSSRRWKIRWTICTARMRDGATKKSRSGKSADKKGKGGKTGKGRKAQAVAEETPHSPADIAKLIEELEKDMRAAARELEFERAAELRDRARALRERLYVSGRRGRRAELNAVLRRRTYPGFPGTGPHSRRPANAQRILRSGDYHSMAEHKKNFFSGMHDGIPIALGYFAVSFTAGHRLPQHRTFGL